MRGDELSDDEDDDEIIIDCIGAAVCCYLYLQLEQNERGRNIERVRLDWERHVRSITPSMFRRAYRMDLPSFNELLRRINYRLTKDDRKARHGKICPASRLAVTLRFLAGGSYIDICFCHGISEVTFYRVVWETVDAIAAVLHIRYGGDDEMKRVSDAFAKKTDGIMDGCIGAVDGLAIKIRRPRVSAINNQASYFNRKGFYSINCQAICDHRCRFKWFSCKTSGRSHDSSAFASTRLADELGSSQLGEEYWIAGDDAYPIGPHLLTPYAGRGLGKEKDAYNFHHSSIRITIER